MTAEPNIRIFRNASCPSLSGTSTIGYLFGTDDAGNIAIQISSASGGGFFSREYVPLDLIEKALRSAKGAIASGTLHALFRGKSVNSAGYLLAVLRQEHVVQLRHGKSRQYELGDLEAFLHRVHTSAAAKKPASSKGRASQAPSKAIQRKDRVKS